MRALLGFAQARELDLGHASSQGLNRTAASSNRFFVSTMLKFPFDVTKSLKSAFFFSFVKIFYFQLKENILFLVKCIHKKKRVADLKCRILSPEHELKGKSKNYLSVFKKFDGGLSKFAHCHTFFSFLDTRKKEQANVQSENFRFASNLT